MGSSVRSRPGRKLVQACFGMAKAYLGFLVTLETPVDIQCVWKGNKVYPLANTCRTATR